MSTAAAAHELRILDGLHAGARAPLAGGLAQRLAIGSGLDNDIVLGDPGIEERHAQLLWDAASGRWHLLAPGQAEPGRGPGHGLGEAVALGPVRVTVAAANDPFDLPAGPWTPEPALVAEPLPEPEAEVAPAPPPAARKRLRAGALPAAGAALLALLVAAGLWFFQQGATRDAAPRAAPLPAAAAPVADHRVAVRAVLQARALDGRLQVGGTAQRPVVTGLMADDEALEALADALARLSPRPGLQVWTLEQVRAALREAGVAVAPALQLAVDGQGALRLSGPVASEAAAVDLQQRVQALLPPGVAVSARLDTPARLAERFVAEARAQGFRLEGRLDGAADRPQLQLTVDLPEADRLRWERWLLEMQRQMAGALSFTATLRAAPPPPRSDQRLPFRVRSIVGGASPYLVLADGTQLVPGARHGDVTLVRIDDAALVLQRAGQTFEVPR